MASRRELKKNVNYIAGELFMECLVNSLYVPGTDKTKADELMGRNSVKPCTMPRIRPCMAFKLFLLSGMGGAEESLHRAPPR